ncbi:MAG TPA: DUF3445 domain-containing protein [Pseudolysinimonas sp.]|nr:DUF3445 domain-containing protein [Pseudolysinimonas sp.]
MTEVLSDAIRTFTYPFIHDTYRYSTNVEKAGVEQKTEVGSWGGTILNVTDEYHHEIAERARVMARDDSRYAVLPHMYPASWDGARHLMRLAAQEFPEHFQLEEEGDSLHWHNSLLGIDDTFRYGDDASLPMPPLEYIGRQLGEDIVLMDEREGHLWVDAGLVTFAAGWSLAFNVGMDFQRMHGPVPRAVPEGVFVRAEQFLLRLQPGDDHRRLNWVFQPDRHLDLGMNSYPDWLPSIMSFMDDIGDDEFADRVHIRIEIQHFIRLAESNAVMFLISTRLLSLRDLARVPSWARQTLSVVEEVPQDMVDYKGMTDIRPAIVKWLTEYVARLDEE